MIQFENLKMIQFENLKMIQPALPTSVGKSADRFEN